VGEHSVIKESPLPSFISSLLSRSYPSSRMVLLKVGSGLWLAGFLQELASDVFCMQKEAAAAWRAPARRTARRRRQRSFRPPRALCWRCSTAELNQSWEQRACSAPPPPHSPTKEGPMDRRQFTTRSSLVRRPRGIKASEAPPPVPTRRSSRMQLGNPPFPLFRRNPQTPEPQYLDAGLSGG
jgi:hypothetical protein